VIRIDHIGIAVEDLEAARSIWDGLLGQEPECEEVESQKVLAAMYPCGIELVSPTAEESPISRFLKTRGSGIHHVTIEVDRIEDQLRRLKAAGVRLINETPVLGAGGHKVAFLHPKAAGGVLVELKQKEGA
jgi:methylmalonyl-CoA/ethylmalonyl-CoA epimerase